MTSVTSCPATLADGESCGCKSIRVVGRLCRSCHNWRQAGHPDARKRYVKRSGQPCRVVFANGRKCSRAATLVTGACSSCNRWSANNGDADPDGRPFMRGNGERLATLNALMQIDTDACVDFEVNSTMRPAVQYGGVDMNASRVVWIVANGDPGELFVLHTCHRGLEGCVNLRHLYVGTATDNVRDMCEASRCRHWGRHDH